MDIILPIIHNNGTSKDALIEQLCEVYNALDKTMDALCQAVPNGRDYYPVDGLLIKAQEQHERRQKTLSDLKNEIEEEIKMIELANKD